MTDPMPDETTDSLRRSVQSLTEELVGVYEELALLHTLGPRLARLASEEAIATEAVTAALDAIRADCGWVALWDDDQPRLPGEAVRGIPAAAVRYITETILAPLHFLAKPAILSHAWSDEHRCPFEESPQRFLATALTAGGGSLGYLCIGRRAGRPPFDSTNQKLLAALASLVALDLENIRLRQAELDKARLEAELDLARAVQRSLLPRDFRNHGFLEADGLSLPCQQVGGDYFDLLPAGDACLLVMADVFGKGPAAALQAQLLQGMVHGAACHTHQVAELLRTLNTCLRERGAPGSYVTAFVATLDRAGRLRYINAGHNAPLWIRPAGVQPLTAGGPLLGLLENPCHQEAVLQLAPGDILLLYTDGVTEALNDRGETFGEVRVIEWAARQAGASPADVCSGLHLAVQDFSGGRPYPDDLALLAVRFSGDRP
jgi:serine phosphatase RsbU (regulator of sigma subunit)